MQSCRTVTGANHHGIEIPLKRFIAVVFLCFTIGQAGPSDARWGWSVHRFINEQACDALPPVMDFFKTYRGALSEHATDPDQDNLPGYYHYMDIDAYPEFFSGTLPQEWDAFIDQYGYNTAIDNGIVPWVITWWTDSLSRLMQTGEWDLAVQVAAELGHYVADAHNPLHLTLNYNGQNTGNNGIHSRYESQMVTPHLDEIGPPTGQGIFWENAVDSVFQWVNELYPNVAVIMAADDSASGLDPSYTSAYYATMWSLLDSITIDALERAARDLASLWYSAWVRADYRVPLSSLNALTGTIMIPTDFPTIQEGIAAGVEGEDLILVQPGIYSETIDFMGKELVVRSTQGPQVTIIEAPDTGHVVQFVHQEGPGARLEGFTIRGGTSFIGGGILCDSSSPVIRHNIITDNTAGLCAGLGGGLAVINGANPVIMNNTIVNNQTVGFCDCICYFGGGIYVDYSSFPVIGGSPEHGNNIYNNSGDIGFQLYRAGAAEPITASYNYWGGDCPPDTVWAVWPGDQFVLNPCRETEWNLEVYAPVAVVPEAYALITNFPNPFNTSTTIEYQIKKKTEVELSVFDLKGNNMIRLVRSLRGPGTYRLTWNGKDQRGKALSSGLYLCRLQTANGLFTRKLVLLK